MLNFSEILKLPTTHTTTVKTTCSYFRI